MSFKFQWGPFSPELVEKAKVGIQEALNKGSKPSTIADTIYVKQLNIGTKPPELELLEIDELSDSKFSGIFKLTYDGDFFITLQTKVQANPINLSLPRGGIVAANKEMICPMELRIKNFKLRGVLTLVVSKHRGVTLAFKNDPLEAVEVSSSFDSIPSTRRFLQAQIEGQLRNLLLETLPKIVHNISVSMKGGKETEANDGLSEDDSLDNEASGSGPSTPTMSRRGSFSDLTDTSSGDFLSQHPKEKVIVSSNSMTSQMARLATTNSTLFPHEKPMTSTTHRTCPPTPSSKRRRRAKPRRREFLGDKKEGAA